MTAEISPPRTPGAPAAVTPAPVPNWPAHWPRPEHPDSTTVEATRAWLAREIQAGRAAATADVPRLGTAAWIALPDSEPAKWLALLRTARAWFEDYITLPERTARELAEERACWAGIIAERDHADYARWRAFCRETAEMIERRERRERDAARKTLPNRTGPELVAAARASWAYLDGPADSAGVGEVA
jgi:hypothetical protein